MLYHNAECVAAVSAPTASRDLSSGICAIDLVAPYELLLWTIIDSHSYAETVSLLHAYQVGHLALLVAMLTTR